MGKQYSDWRRIIVVLSPVLLIVLTGFMRGSWAQDVKPVASEPLEREIAGATEDEPARLTLPAEKRDRGEQDAPADKAVAREPLERNLDRDEAVAEGDEEAEAQGVVEMILGGFALPVQDDAGDDLPANLRPFMPAFNQALTIEIHFLRKVSNPDEEQLKAIRAAGQTKILELARVVARNQHQAFNDESQGGRGPLQKALLASAKKVLPTDKYESYRKELEERKAARLRGACEMMTLNVDNTLSFSLDNYDKVVQLLTEKAQPQWTHTMQAFLYKEYCPLPGVELLKPLLNDRQQKIWSGKSRRSSGIVFGWPANLGLQQWGLNAQLQELDDYSGEVNDE